MATTEQRTSPAAEPLRGQHWNLVWGFLWAGAFLILLGVWIGMKHWLKAWFSAVGVELLGGIALAVGLWQVVTLLLLTGPGQRESLLGQRRTLGLTALGVTAVLLLVMVVLLVWVGPPALPEFLTSLPALLLGAGVGLYLLGGPGRGLTQDAAMRWLVARGRLVMLVLGAAGLALLAAAVVLLWMASHGTAGWPEALGCLLLAGVLGGAALWLYLATPTAVTPTTMRIFVLVTGGAAGLVIFLMMAFRLVLIRSVLGGLDAWYGADAWQRWLTVYVLLSGLVLMFGSLYLAQTDIRVNAALRRLLYGYNAVFTGVLVLAILAVLNVVVYASFPSNFNWTRSQGFYSLSDRTRNILTKLDRPVDIVILMSQKSRDYIDVKNLVDNFRAVTSKVRIHEVSPEIDSKAYLDWKEKYPKVEEDAGVPGARGARGLLVVYGREPGEKGTLGTHAFIPKDKLTDMPFAQTDDPDKPQRRYEFKGESLLITQINFLANQERKPVIYFTQSNGELDLDDATPDSINGAGDLKSALEKTNYEVAKLYWDAPKGEPPPGSVFSQQKLDDAHKVPAARNGNPPAAVVIAWPTQKFVPGAIDALDDYMKGGGSLLILSPAVGRNNRLAETDLEPLAKKYGVRMAQDYVLNLLMTAQGPELLPAVTVADPKTDNPIAAAFDDEEFYFRVPRTVEPGDPVPGFDVESLFEVGQVPGAYLIPETDFGALRNLDALAFRLWRNRGELNARRAGSPVPVAAAVSDRGGRPRMLVYGDGQMASNRQLRLPFSAPPPYTDLVVSSVAWLAGQAETIGVEPKRSNFYTPTGLESPADAYRMVLLPMGLMVLGLTGLGLGVWVVRRR